MRSSVADGSAARPSLAERMRHVVEAAREAEVTALEMVLSALRTGILSGVIEPGERLRQEELADIFETSRIPVREALRALEYEGLVTSEPHRGFTVTTLDADHISEVYELRTLLESHAVRLSVPLLTDEDLRELELLHDQMEDAANPEAALAARERFYLRLYSGSGRARLVGLIARLRQEVARTLRWPTLQHASSFHDHFFIAVKEGDAERAVSQLAAHYSRVATLIRRYLREQEARARGNTASVDRWLMRTVDLG